MVGNVSRIQVAHGAGSVPVVTGKIFLVERVYYAKEYTDSMEG